MQFKIAWLLQYHIDSETLRGEGQGGKKDFLENLNLNS